MLSDEMLRNLMVQWFVDFEHQYYRWFDCVYWNPLLRIRKCSIRTVIVVLDNKNKIMVMKPKRVVHDESMLNSSKLIKPPHCSATMPATLFRSPSLSILSMKVVSIRFATTSLTPSFCFVLCKFMF